MPPGQQVALQPALALVLGQHLDDPPGARQVLVHLGSDEFGVPLFVGCLEHRLKAVRRGLVGAEDPEVVGVEPDHLGEPLAEHLGRLGDGRARRGHVDAERPEVGQPQIFEQQPAVGVRVVAHPQSPCRRQRGDVGVELAVLVE